MKQVKLAPGLSFPAAELASEVSALIGNRGGGKSNGATVVIEEELDAGVQVVILDYVGIYFGLRLGPDGRDPTRYDIPILGGRHGDVELSPAAGRIVAEALAERGSSAILDVSLFSKADRGRFAADFAEAFFAAKKAHPGPCLIVLEEAQRFVPQKLWKGQERLLGAWEEVAEVGRNFGIGLLLITQRPQKIAKDVLNLADNVLAFRTVGKLERDALADWVQEKGAEGRRDIADALPGLATGECYAWSPVRGVFGKYRVRLKSTYDSGATPIAARAKVAPQPLDLEALRQAMGRAADEVQRDTPSALRAECQRLRAEVARLERGKGAPAPRDAKPARVRELERQVKAVRGELDTLTKILNERIPRELDQVKKSFDDGISSFVVNLERTVKYRLTQARNIVAETAAKEVDEPEVRVAPTVRGPLPTSKAEARTNGGKVEGGLSTGEVRILSAAIQHDGQGGVTREQITVLLGYKRSSRDTYVQKLRARGYLAEEDGLLRATSPAVTLMENVAEPLPTGRELLAHWLGRLPEGERRVLAIASDHYPDGVSRDEIDRLGLYKRSSRDTFIQRLKARRLLEDAGGGAVRMSKFLVD